MVGFIVGCFLFYQKKCLNLQYLKESVNLMRVVSFFAGCGGLDLGFRQAGFDVVWANEFEQACQTTYQMNHPSTTFVLDDIRNIDPNSIPDCDGFIGGPPCQSWSVGGKQRGLDDERGQLFLIYIDLIKVKKPSFFVIENVKGMLDKKFKDIFEDFLNRLEIAGYDVTCSLVDACNYGIPQNRERVFILGFRKDLNVSYSFPEPFSSEPISQQRAIGDISEPPNPYVGKRKLGHYSDRANHDVLISKFGPFYLRGNRRRGWHQPSFTINATADFTPLHPSSPKMMFYGHENWNFQQDKLSEYRRLSIRECARLQTFPDNFVFAYENISSGYKMIGNAVPPRLAKIIALSINKVFNRVNVPLGTDSKYDVDDHSVIVGESVCLKWHGSEIFSDFATLLPCRILQSRSVRNRWKHFYSCGGSLGLPGEDHSFVGRYFLAL